MKHIEAGLKVGLGMQADRLTFINIEVLNESTLKSKIMRFLIDIGFNGYLQVSENDVKDLGLDVKNKSNTRLADGREIETGIVNTKVRIFDQEITNFPIQFVPNGVPLIGTSLLRDTKRMIVFDYEDGYVTLTHNPEIKQAIKTLVDQKSV